MCKYCDLKEYEYSSLKKRMYISIDMIHKTSNDYQLLIDTDLDGQETLRIYYCPMCGRYLGGTENGQVQ